MRDPQGAMLDAVPGTPSRQRGHAIVILCPFHRDTNPSCYLYDERRGWYCFVCGQGGSPEDFLRRTRFAHLGERDGYKAAYEHLGTTGPMGTPLRRARLDQWREEARANAERQKGRKLTPAQRSALVTAVGLYAMDLATGYSPVALAYAETRGLLDERGKVRYRTGYCRGQGLAALLTTEERVGAAEIGLLRGLPGGQQGDWTEPFAGRLIIVDLDKENQPRWLTGRAIPGLLPERVASERKYLHLSGAKVLFGEHSCAQASRVVVVEGPLCQIALRTLGIAAVALCGKTLPAGAASFFPRKAVVPCFDAPRDQKEATTLYLDYERLVSDLEPYTQLIEDPIDLSGTGAKDPDEYIRRYGEFVF